MSPPFWEQGILKPSAIPSALVIFLYVCAPASAQPDLRFQQCGLGDQDACFALEFGRCADENPRVAIPACTRDLAQQDNRRIPGNLRLARATRYALRALAYAKQGDLDLALSDYDRAISSDGDIFWIQMQRGDANFLAGNDNAALESYDAAVELVPDSALALIYRAMILAASVDEGLRDPVQALNDAQSANEIDPGQPAYIDVLAVALAANGDFERAIDEAQRAISLLPPNDLSSRDDYESRIALYEQSMPFLMER